jgi:hypothetical protein
MWAILMGWLSRLAGWFAPGIKDTAVDLVKAAANTPVYKPSTKAESVASEQVKVEVVDNIKKSELWEALHKN